MIGLPVLSTNLPTFRSAFIELAPYLQPKLYVGTEFREVDRNVTVKWIIPEMRSVSTDNRKDHRLKVGIWLNRWQALRYHHLEWLKR